MGTRSQLRGVKVVAVILDAVVEAISEKGYAALTVDAVAERANVNKTTIYRRWPTKDDLVLAALAREGEGLFVIPDTGSLAKDLVLVAVRLGSFLRTERGRALYVMYVQHGPEKGSIAFPEENIRQARAIVERGVARGELPPRTDITLFVSVFLGAVMQAIVLGTPDVTESFFHRLVSFVVAGNEEVTRAPKAKTRRATRPKPARRA